MGDFKSTSYALCIACIAVVLRGADYFGLGSYGGTAILAIAFLAMMVYARYTHDYLDFPAAANTKQTQPVLGHGQMTHLPGNVAGSAGGLQQPLLVGQVCQQTLCILPGKFDLSNCHFQPAALIHPPLPVVGLPVSLHDRSQ